MIAVEKIIDLGYIKISAKVWGESSSLTPVLLIHGWLDNANSFDPVMAHLSDNRQYIAIDLPGHGHSDHKPQGQLYHFLDGVADLRKVIDGLGLERVILVGHSLGAALSSTLASIYPDLIERVCLIEAVGPISSDSKDSARQLKESIDKQMRGAGRNLTVYETLEAMIQARQKGVGGLSYEASELLVKRSHTRTDQGYRWSTDPRLRLPSAMRLSESQVKGLLTKLSIPLKIIIAENSLIPKPMIDLRLSYFEAPDVVYFQGGHHLHMETSSKDVAEQLNLFINCEH